MNKEKNNQEKHYALQCILLISFFLSLPLQLQARTSKNKLILCLAKEEETIHKGKSTGPIYKLNQTLLNKLIVAASLRVKPIYISRICESAIYSPSLKFLHFLLSEGENVFQDNKGLNPKDPAAFQMQIGTELVQESPDIFFRFLSNLQAATPLAGCLETEIPELQSIYDRAKHLRGEISEDKVFKEENLTNRLFGKLANFNKYYKKCEQRKKEKMEKLKKTPQ